jgi:hypothetical protein
MRLVDRMTAARFNELHLLAFCSAPHSQEDAEWRAHLQESMREIKAQQEVIAKLTESLDTIPRAKLCGHTMECGGSCVVPLATLPDHAGPHLCAGDNDGPGTCPA